MKILAADTSTASGSVALLDGFRLKAEWTLDSASTHNRRLLKTIDQVLAEVQWELQDVDGFAVTVGPGSFTGLRIGLSTMKSLAWALGKPIVGVSSLEALAVPLAFTPRPVCAVIDARKKEVYAAVYRSDGSGSLRLQGDVRVIDPAGVEPLIDEPAWFCGDGWLTYEWRFRELLGERAVGAPAPCHTIRAAVVAGMARCRLEDGRVDDAVHLVPVYVRRSEAEINNPGLARSFLSGV